MKTQDAQNYCEIGTLLLVQYLYSPLKKVAVTEVYISLKGKVFHSLIVDRKKEF